MTQKQNRYLNQQLRQVMSIEQRQSSLSNYQRETSEKKEELDRLESEEQEML